MKKIELEEKIERKRRFTLISAVIICATLVLTFLQLLFSNHLASFGQELMTLSGKERELSFENGLLAKKVASESAIATIAKKAQNLDFNIATKLLVVEEKNSLAKLSTNGL